jgi:hypothetical protein
VVRKLTEKAALFVDYTRSVGLSMNALKMQLLLSANAGNVADVTMMGDGNTISTNNTIGILGVKYKGSCQRPTCAVFACGREATGVDRSEAVQPPAKGKVPAPIGLRLVVGKFSHALAAVARPRLSDKENASTTWSKIQVAFNNDARSITGVQLRDHVTITNLLSHAKSNILHSRPSKCVQN